MSKYRHHLPQLGSHLFLTDGGLETTLVFHEGLDLPCFAAFDLVRDERGKGIMRRYYERYIGIAKAAGLGFILEAPTWRANPDWAAKLGYTEEALAAANDESIALMRDLRDAHETAGLPMVISGNVGPRGDGYRPDSIMTPEEAEAYHRPQVRGFSRGDADLVSAFTITNANEAIGITRAAMAAKIPVVVSFTLETDGRLPTGQPLSEAIAVVDSATARAPAYYMVNCVHPDHFAETLSGGGDWLKRLRGIRANASRKSHAELDASTDLDIGDPAELGVQYRDLVRRYPQIVVAGGCCGTDHRHVERICTSCRVAA